MPTVQPKDPEIKVTLNHDGLERLEIFADTRADRDRAIRAVLSASDIIEQLKRAVCTVL
jgi:hypothetical protein